MVWGKFIRGVPGETPGQRNVPHSADRTLGLRPHGAYLVELPYPFKLRPEPWELVEEPIDGFEDLDLLGLNRVDPVAIYANGEKDFHSFLPEGITPDGVDNVGA